MDEPVANINKRAKNRQCFFRNQGPNYPVDDFPCFPEQEHSVCCKAGDACMSNGLCRAPGDLDLSAIRYTRGSCTDETCTGLVFYWFSPSQPLRFADIFVVKGRAAFAHRYANTVRVPTQAIHYDRLPINDQTKQQPTPRARLLFRSAMRNLGTAATATGRELIGGPAAIGIPRFLPRCPRLTP